MTNIQDIANEIVAREGGYVDDPDDPGGATKHGVTLGTLKHLGRDLNGDGRIDKADVQAMTPERAADIFLEHYFRGPRIAELPEALQPTVFDMYVNAGAQAVRILQRLLVLMGESIAVDGAIGPQTVAACMRAHESAGPLLVDAYGIERRNYYYALADRRAPLRKFARRRDGGKGGWIRRAEEFISPRFHFTEDQHNQRVAQWA